MMKKIFLGFLFLIAMGFKEDDTSMLYVQALQEHIQKIASSIEEPEEKNFFSEKPVYVLNEDIVELPVKIGKHVLKTIDEDAKSIIERGGSIHVIKLHPMKAENGEFVITLSDFVVKKDDGDLTFNYSGGRSFYFTYDQSTRKYRIKKTKLQTL